VTDAKRAKLRPAFLIAILEIAMLAGIVVALFTVPRDTPLRTFIVISVALFLLANILLFKKLRRSDLPKATSSSSENRQRSLRVYVLTGLMVLFMLCEYLIQKLHIHLFP
jgi:predicted membrane channel-forming protein YqfA (hemolysin III family)